MTVWSILTLPFLSTCCTFSASVHEPSDLGLVCLKHYRTYLPYLAQWYYFVWNEDRTWTFSLLRTCSSCAHDNRVIAVINYRVLAGDCVFLHLKEQEYSYR
jgi:hypothetical protein